MIVVHALDVAVATGQEDAIDEEQAAALLELMQDMGVDAFRVPGMFARRCRRPACTRPRAADGLPRA